MARRRLCVAAAAALAGAIVVFAGGPNGLPASGGGVSVDTRAAQVDAKGRALVKVVSDAGPAPQITKGVTGKLLVRPSWKKDGVVGPAKTVAPAKSARQCGSRQARAVGESTGFVDVGPKKVR